MIIMTKEVSKTSSNNQAERNAHYLQNARKEVAHVICMENQRRSRQSLQPMDKIDVDTFASQYARNRISYFLGQAIGFVLAQFEVLAEAEVEKNQKSREIALMSAQTWAVVADSLKVTHENVDFVRYFANAFDDVMDLYCNAEPLDDVREVLDRVINYAQDSRLSRHYKDLESALRKHGQLSKVFAAIAEDLISQAEETFRTITLGCVLEWGYTTLVSCASLLNSARSYSPDNAKIKELAEKIAGVYMDCAQQAGFVHVFKEVQPRIQKLFPLMDETQRTAIESKLSALEPQMKEEMLSFSRRRVNERVNELLRITHRNAEQQGEIDFLNGLIQSSIESHKNEILVSRTVATQYGLGYWV